MLNVLFSEMDPQVLCVTADSLGCCIVIAYYELLTNQMSCTGHVFLLISHYKALHNCCYNALCRTD